MRDNYTIKVLIVGLGRVGWLYDYRNKASNSFLSHYKSILEIAKEKKYPIDLFFFDNDTNACSRFLAETEEDPGRLLSSKYGIFDNKWDLIILAVNTENLITTLTPILKETSNPKIVVEKPFTNKGYLLRNFLQTTTQAEQNRIRVGFPRRTLPSSRIIHREVSSWQIDKEINITLQFSGGFANIASHFIDLLEYWFGELEIESTSQHRNILIKGVTRPNLVLKIEQTGETNKEDAKIICQDLEYTRSGRYINVRVGEKRVVFENEVDTMLLFESRDYLNWIINDGETVLTPINSKALDLSLTLEDKFANV